MIRCVSLLDSRFNNPPGFEVFESGIPQRSCWELRRSLWCCQYCNNRNLYWLQLMLNSCCWWNSLLPKSFQSALYLLFCIPLLHNYLWRLEEFSQLKALLVQFPSQLQWHHLSLCTHRTLECSPTLSSWWSPISSEKLSTTLRTFRSSKVACQFLHPWSETELGFSIPIPPSETGIGFSIPPPSEPGIRFSIPLPSETELGFEILSSIADAKLALFLKLESPVRGVTDLESKWGLQSTILDLVLLL